MEIRFVFFCLEGGSFVFYGCKLFVFYNLCFFVIISIFCFMLRVYLIELVFFFIEFKCLLRFEGF